MYDLGKAKYAFLMPYGSTCDKPKESKNKFDTYNDYVNPGMDCITNMYPVTYQ